ncbi:hypothetical protein R70006_05050 [Paraburkholderia domus]|uniref:hypothetical protein n=1 Tax=Paraburkholderia domus TaxID=2793075 RepID=UPI00191468FB|nr:hypothetical protein [Paraburkholderia domus]MBK5051713.1 hypothetical protein [Burkholderia sp. R-70006]CAE6795426.1 hypothetical protein R70006_05050 [Paraburkholderia domus]
MTAPTLETFNAQLGMLLRDQPSGIAAELTDFAVAYWNGHDVVYAFLRDDGSGRIDEEFDPADFQWEDLVAAFAAWLTSQRFSERAEVKDWLRDAPPFDAGT